MKIEIRPAPGAPQDQKKHVKHYQVFLNGEDISKYVRGVSLYMDVEEHPVPIVNITLIPEDLISETLSEVRALTLKDVEELGSGTYIVSDEQIENLTAIGDEIEVGRPRFSRRGS